MSSKATALSTELWGGILHSDNRGFYTSLEFFALLAGLDSVDAASPERWSDVASLEFRIPGHILARCFAIDPNELYDEQLADHIEPDIVPIVRDIVRSLKVRIPGAGKAGQSWNGSHFVPYGKGLTHWDARFSRNRPRIERIYFRGAGTLALRILLEDPDRERALESLTKTRALLEREHFTGHLLGVFHDLEPEYVFVHGTQDTSTRANEANIDSQILVNARAFNDHWDETLRAGVHAIATSDAPEVVRLDALYHFIPFVLLLAQVGRSHAWRQSRIGKPLSRPIMPLVVDASPPDSRTNEVRQAAHRSFTRAQQAIIEAFRTAALEQHLTLSSNQVTQFRAYFTRGAPAIGFLNAVTGARRFVLGASLLEALVIAFGRAEVTFEDFVGQWLRGSFGLVIDKDGALANGLDREADLSIFDDNASQLADTLGELGLMQNYSDATRMVRYGF